MLKYGPKARKACSLQVLGFPCSQFAHQEPGKDDEIMNGLKYVRPGQGFVPNFTLFSKLDVNGAQEDAFYSWVKSVCPRPDATIATTSSVLWSPIKVGDIRWNFEKFLFDHTGKPLKRYDEAYLPLLMENDVKQLIGNCMKAKQKTYHKSHPRRSKLGNHDDDNEEDNEYFEDDEDKPMAMILQTRYV